MDNARNNMFEELFISPEKGSGEVSIPFTSKTECLEMIRSKGKPEARIVGLAILADWYRLETVRSAGKHDAAACDELIGIVRDFGRQYPEAGVEIVTLLVQEGAESEKARDYETAIKFYKARLEFPCSDPKFRYYRLDNLGFCFNFFRKFGAAEEFLRGAIAIDPEYYNAWKNLGVALEHQSKYDEAAECYIKAIQLSGGNPKSIKHYIRLHARQPGLAGKYPRLNIQG